VTILAGATGPLVRRQLRLLLMLWASVMLAVPCLGCGATQSRPDPGPSAEIVAADQDSDETGRACGCAAPCATPGCAALSVVQGPPPGAVPPVRVAALAAAAAFAPVDLPPSAPDPGAPFHPPRA
jgi:hypothetical protein